MIIVISSVLCGASYLQIHDDLDELKIYPEEELSCVQSNPLVSFVQDLDWSCSNLLKVIEIFSKLKTFLSVEGEALSVLLREVVGGGSQSNRSLIQEYLNHDQACNLSAAPSSSQVTVRSVLTLTELRDLLTNNPAENEASNDVDLTDPEAPAVFVKFNVDPLGQSVCADNKETVPTVGNFEGLRLNSVIKLERFRLLFDGEESFIFLEKFKEMSPKCDMDMFCDITAGLNITEKKEFCILSKSNILRNLRKPGLYFYVLCKDSSGERSIFKINKVTKYYLMRENETFGVQDQKISLESERFELSKYYGNLPLFQVCGDDLDILERKTADITKEVESYDLREVDVIPIEEPVNITAVVIEKNSETCQTESISSKICLKISAEEDLSIAYNLYLASNLSCGFISSG